MSKTIAYRESGFYHSCYQTHVFRRRRVRIRHMRDGKTSNFDVVQASIIAPRLISYFQKKKIVSEQYCVVKGTIEIPIYFSFAKDYDGSVMVYKQLISTYIHGTGKIVIDFSKCKQSDISNFLMLNVVVTNLESLKNRYNLNRYRGVSRTISIIPSLTDAKTNKYLKAYRYHNLDSQFDDGSKYMVLESLMGRYLGKYRGNYKSVTAAKIAKFVESSAEPYGYVLNDGARKLIEQYVTEVLNNAEDHSLAKSEWFVDGICFNETQHDTNIIELNLAIMNIGSSMYEGFEETKELNTENYARVQKIYDYHKKQFTLSYRIEKEALFMLYMLNDGVSRLKYMDGSRGNGTMSFIEAFLALGNYGEINKNFEPCLHIISGHSVITCDSQYAPYVHDSMHILSLNKERDIRKLPDKNYLQYNHEYLPGTILECKIYLNKEHIINSINNE